MINTKPVIFVFGSNMGGLHGKGAAKYASDNYGALNGIGYGVAGRSFAIPTKSILIINNKRQVGKALSLNDINAFVKGFLAYAANMKNFFNFKVTRIGCGLAGYTDAQIAPMFREATSNCYFDKEWTKNLGTNKNYW